MRAKGSLGSLLGRGRYVGMYIGMYMYASYVFLHVVMVVRYLPTYKYHYPWALPNMELDRSASPKFRCLRRLPITSGSMYITCPAQYLSQVRNTQDALQTA